MKIKVIAAILDTHELNLYKEDGTVVTIKQGDPRVARIIAEVTPTLSIGGTVEVNLDIDPVNHYKEFEDNSSGLVKLFKVAKSRLKGLFSIYDEKPVTKKVAPISLGSIPRTKEEKITEALAEIMEHAVSVSSPEFDDSVDAEKETVIAVVEQVNAAPAVISSMENIKPQLVRSNAMGQSKGMAKFMERMAAIVGTRRHSVEDLLKFLQRGDLPIADDGSIIIYKVLCRKVTGHGFVDCHTRLVPQSVGSYVCMDESLVDQDRRNECSNGLHVARRGYISGFSGDVCVLAKVNPEDVIAVPEHDANKMRVCGYHIIAELTDEEYKKLKSDQPITDSPTGKTLLGKAIAGQHTGITEIVRIGGHKGTKITVTMPSDVTATSKSKVTPTEALDTSGKEVAAPIVEPLAVVQATKAQDAVVPSNGNSRQSKAQAMWDAMNNGKTAMERQAAAQQLKDFKKTSKVSWKALGLAENAGDTIAAKLA